jgi:hypothetical protein
MNLILYQQMRDVDDGAELEDIEERRDVKVDISACRLLGIFTSSQVKGSASDQEQPGLRYFTLVT